MTKMTGGEAVVDSLIANGIDTVFGLPGVQLDPIFVALHDRQDEIKVMHTRHEQGAGYMAMGYAEATGKIGTVMVVPGPGLLNAGASILTAHGLNTPVLCIAGQGKSSLLGKGYGVLHEMPDQLATARSFVDWGDKITHPGNVSEKIAQAIEVIHDGRTRPVYLEIPFDIAGDSTTVPDAVKADQTPRYPVIDEDLVEQAAEKIAKATCPLIMIGGGTKNAGPAIQRLSEKLNAPVAMTQNALGVMDSRHPNSYTPVEGYHWWDKADVVLAIGTRLFPTAITLRKGGDFKIIKVDVDPEELNRLPGAIDGIQGEASMVADLLCDAVEKYLPATPVDRSELSESVRTAAAKEVDVITPQRELLHVIREEIGEKGVTVFDVTQLYFAAPDAMPFHHPRTFIHASYQGTLGMGVSTALGAKVGTPDQPVICIAGDGGFQFTINELITAVQYNIQVIFLVMNDGAYGNVKRILKENYNNRVICADLTNPDFVKVAEAYGMPGRHANSPQTLRAVLKESLKENGPCLIEYAAPEYPSPWHLHMRKPLS